MASPNMLERRKAERTLETALDEAEALQDDFDTLWRVRRALAAFDACHCTAPQALAQVRRIVTR